MQRELRIVGIRKTWGQLRELRPMEMELLGDELKLIRARVLAERRGYGLEDPRAYHEAVLHYFRAFQRQGTDRRTA
jgi:hypothetical protein